MRHLLATLAWRRASLRPPWKREPWTLAEHFGITAALTLLTAIPYLWVLPGGPST